MCVILLKPLYGLSESEDSCFHKHTYFLKKEIDLSTIEGDLSLHFKHEAKAKDLQGSMAVYIYDTLQSGNVEFEELMHKMPKTFE